MANRAKRPLAQLAAAPSAPPPSSSSPVSTHSTLTRKRRNITAACEACRRRKSRCNGERPKCRLCVERSTECHYATDTAETHSRALKRKYDELQTLQAPYDELFHLLRTVSEKDSLEILRRIRAGGDVANILSQVKEGNLLLQLSLVPETRRRYDFPYVSAMPASLLLPDNPYLESPICDTVFNRRGRASTVDISRDETHGNDNYSPYLRPIQAAEFVDPLLSRVTVSRWTSVISDDELLKRLFGAYFLYQHHWHFAFNKDYFLADMAAGRERFCSPLLVNSILASATHCLKAIPNRAKFWIPSSLGYRFLAEAKRLWELEAGKSKLTTIQAAIILNIRVNMDGLDKIGRSYLLQMVAMAHNMQLLKAPADTDKKSEKMRRAQAFTAWGLFCWQTTQCYYFFRPPLIKEPPEFPLPDPAADPEWYGGEIWLRYPLTQTLWPLQFGYVFKAICDLRVVMNEMSAEFFGDNLGPRMTPSMQTVLYFRSKIDNWFTNLPDVLSATRIVLPCHLRIHFEYYSTIISLYRPHVAIENESNQSSSSRLDISPEEIILQARIRLETLIRMYYLRHSFDTCDTLIVYFLVLLGNMTVEALSTTAPAALPPTDPDQSPPSSSTASQPSSSTSSSPPAETDLRSTLVLCAAGLRAQGQNYQLANLAHRAWRNSLAFRPAEKALLELYAAARGGADDAEDRLMLEYAQAQWPLPIIRIDEDPRTVTLEVLVKEYEGLGVDGDGLAGETGESSVGSSPAPGGS